MSRSTPSSKYVVETGPGYLGVNVASAPDWATISCNYDFLSWVKGDTIYPTLSEWGVVLSPSSPGDPIISCDVIEPRHGTYVRVRREVLWALDVHEGEDIRVYRYGDDELLLVNADNDPMIGKREPLHE